MFWVERHLIRSSAEGNDVIWDELIPEGQETLVLEAVHQVGPYLTISLSEAGRMMCYNGKCRLTRRS